MPSVYDILKISAYNIGHIISESLATLIFEKINLLGACSQCSHDHDDVFGECGATMKT